MMKNVREMENMQCFKYENEIYMYTEHTARNWDGDTQYMCININTKEIKFIDGWTQVETVNVKIIVE